MSDAPATTHTHVDIDGHDFLLSPGQDLEDLMRRIEDAARSEGTFVGFISQGVRLSALISRTSRVVIAIDDDPATGPPSDLGEYAHAEWEY